MNVLIKDVLEWLSFGGALFSTFLYGKTKKQGAVSGMVVACLFQVWGVVTQQWAAAIVNVAFAVIHYRNYRIACDEESIDNRSA